MNCLPFPLMRSSALILTGVLVAGAGAQTGASSPSLSLTTALSMARQRNGTVKSAEYLVNAANQRVTESFAAFLPTVTPTYTYNSSRQQYQVGTTTPVLQTEGGSTTINSSLTILDSGQRLFNYDASRRSLSSQQFSAKQTLRTTLFSVTQQYYETLRAQELLNVSQSQVDRTGQILAQTKARIQVRDAAAIEELQANADFQNARVALLVSRNSLSTNTASLKGLIGFDSDQPLPALEKTDVPVVPIAQSSDMLVHRGLADRPDLLSLRRSVEATHFSYLAADRTANLGVSVSLNYDQQVTPTWLQDRVLLFSLTYPLFDGGLTRAQARELKANYFSQKATLVQAERSARAEIESAFAEDTQNSERLDASKIALDAAQKNYAAALESQKLGSYDLIQVLTANVSLVTAQSNYIQAIYDYAISDVNLKLVTGQPIPGE
jgi:outer membrane protein